MIGPTLLIATLQQATLTGVVRDSVDLEPVAFAEVTVTLVGGEAVTASGAADRFGAFVLPRVPTNRPVRVEVGAYGYSVWTSTYEVVPSDPIRVLLSPAPFGLEEIEAAVSFRAGDPLSLSRDAFVIDSVLIRSLPTILETDVLRAIQVSPSASAASDYSSIPFIRGGTSDGTPVLLDGVRLFNAVHLGGLHFGDQRRSGRPRDIADRIGGRRNRGRVAVGRDRHCNQGRSRDKRRVAGSLGLASSRLSVEGPIGESVSYLVDGRRTYIDGFTAGLEKMGAVNQHLPYFFQDLHAKVTTDLGGVRRLSVSGYLNSESLQTYDEERDAAAGHEVGQHRFLGSLPRQARAHRYR